MTDNDIIKMAREAGMKASIGKTDKNGVYQPYVNALGKDVPIEWLEAFADLVLKSERQRIESVGASLYEKTGEILDINILLLRRNDIRGKV